MNFQFYIEKLFESEEFAEFKKEFPDAYLCSGFFVIDLTNSENQQHLDFFVPSFEKMFSFQLESNLQRVPLENIGEKPEKLFANYDFDFKDVEEKIKKEMDSRGIKNQIQKFLFSLQRKGDKDFLVSTIFTSNMGILSASISLPDLSVENFEKKSFLDMFKIIKK